MPVDNSRRTSRKHSTHDDDIDARRARGEISCAECRRLKLKCDKKLPCSSCIRRGCPSICPNGSLSTGQGTRFVLADTTQLHNKISEMGQRIRQLEDALAIFQAGVSNECHALLRDDLLAIKFGPENGKAPEKRSSDLSADAIDALGTLTIGDHGEAKYFGRSAGSETLFLAGADMEMTCAEDDYPPIPLEVARLSNSFPFTADGSVNWEKALDTLIDHLPERPRAWALCETYLEHASWSFRPIQRDEIVDDILTPAYRCAKERKNGAVTAAQIISSHKLAVLFILFAIGSLVDLTLEPYNYESEHYYHLSRAALSLRSLFDSPEIATVQAVVLIASYHGMGGQRYTMDSTWNIMSLGAKLAQSLGLHRDSARWKMDAKTVQRRRSLFYEIFCADLFHSIALGRPPSIRLSYVDCEYPIDDEASLGANGEVKVGYYQWKYEFCKEIFSDILELTLTAEAPSYQTILDLDRKVREKVLPSHLNVFMNPEDENCSPSAFMHGCLLGQYRTVTLLYIHRSFFAQAMLDHPINPLRSPYAPSFLAAYRCASGVIKSSLNYYERFPELCCRWWGVWTHLFSAAIIVGSIVTRSPSSSMAANAFIELGLACDLFEKGSHHSRRARSGIGILYSLKNKAFQIYSQFRSGNPPPPNAPVGSDYGEDELALFGGQTRILFSKLMSSRGVNRKTPSSSPSTNSPNAPSVNPTNITSTSREAHQKDSQAPSPSGCVPDVHPSLVEYLSLLPPSQYPRASPPQEALASPTPVGPAPAQASSSAAFPSVFTPSPTILNDRSGQSSPSSSYPLHSVQPQMNGSEPSSLYHDLDCSFLASNLYPLTGTMDPTIDDAAVKLVDLGMMMSGDSGIDEQWKSFMRDSGLLDQDTSVDL
ncbi:fungal-specific transcription factor domain-containing protein [Armillaria borealis]|uniref:Fungal-specific transcription factor domain-containing protein n=1 Tax=Armillaria borealis TaxID=47425 RepID=A0AA39K3D3_9AGAR|nr:fungal-specific transcription factor domain-containing protein [Armillaria borealis]